MIFGKRLKKLRTDNNITQLRLSEILGTAKSNISKYESDTIEPNLAMLSQLSELFHVSVDYLLGIERSEKQGGISMNLKQLRERAGLSQVELGNLVGLKQTTISQYENGTREPNLDLTQKIADVLDVSLDELVRPVPLEVEDNDKENFGHTIANTKFGEILRSLRLERNITQKDLADRLSISPSTVGMYEQNRRFPDADILVKLSSIPAIFRKRGSIHR